MHLRIIILLLSVCALVWAGGVRVSNARDEITLTNGKIIKGTILIEGSRRVIVLVNSKEVDIVPADIVSIKRGAPSADATDYITAQQGGSERIVRQGTAPSQPAARPRPAQRKPAASTGSKQAVKPQNNRGGAKPSPQQLLQKAMRDPALMNKLKEMKKKGQLDKFLKDNNILINKDVQKIINQLGN